MRELLSRFRPKHNSRDGRDPTTAALYELADLVKNIEQPAAQRRVQESAEVLPSENTETQSIYSDDEFPLEITVSELSKSSVGGRFNRPAIERQAKWLGLRGIVNVYEEQGRPTEGVSYSRPLGGGGSVGPRESRTSEVTIGRNVDTTISIYPEQIIHEVRYSDVKERDRSREATRRVNDAVNIGLIEAAREQIFWKDKYLSQSLKWFRHARLAAYTISASAALYLSNTSFMSIFTNPGLLADRSVVDSQTLLIAGGGLLCGLVGWMCGSYIKSNLKDVYQHTGFFEKPIERFPWIEKAILESKVAFNGARRLLWIGGTPKLYTKSKK